MKKGEHDSSASRPENRRSILAMATSAAAVGAAAILAPAAARAAAYPSRPISFLVGFTPGSVTDLMARILAAGLPARLGQTVIVENRSGASGTISVSDVARARPDGYTICLVTPASLITGPLIYKNLPFDPVKDLAPVIKLATSTIALVVPAKSPITSLKDLMRRMKAAEKDRPFRYASTGNSTSLHLLGSLLADLAGASATQVPYRGTAEQVRALMAGEVDFGFTPVMPVIGNVKSGRLRALGVTAARPSPLLPDVPSLYMAGLEEVDKTRKFGEADPFFGVVAPKGTPDSIVQTLHRAFAAAVADPAIRAKFIAVGFDPVPPSSSADFGVFIRNQFTFWRALLKSAGVTSE